MKISRGTSRTVLIFENFVIKLPRIYFWRTMKNVYRSIRRGYFIKSLGWSIYSSMSPKRLLFKGFLDNWREFTYCRELRSPFLQPTYFSLLGLFNIQKVGEKLTVKQVDLWCQLYEMTSGEVFADSHTFANPDNFCQENERLKMLDYGNARIYEVLKKYGDKIFKNFDFSYDWEERKKQL